ncbi:MAG: hypothetical protein IH587_08125 [Anaerolineae bacterium]|nr:hypothetical protein [Anaerolineae bacterium]
MPDIDDRLGGVSMNDVEMGVRYFTAYQVTHGVPMIKHIYVDGVDVIYECCACFMPVLPGVKAKGWAAVFTKNEDFTLKLDPDSDTPVIETLHGNIYWT